MRHDWQAGPFPVQAALTPTAAPIFIPVTAPIAETATSTPPPSSRLNSIKDWFSTIQSGILAAASILGLLAVIVFLLDTVTEEKIIINYITVPKEMTDRGYSKEVITDRIIDSIQKLNYAATTSKARYQTTPISASSDNIIVPESAAALKQFMLLARKHIRIRDPRVSGEFICFNDSCKKENFQLRIRISTEEVFSFDFPPMKNKLYDEYITTAAEAIMNVVDPHTYASYLLAVGRGNESISVAKRTYVTGHRDAKWAAVMVGNHYQDQTFTLGLSKDMTVAKLFDTAEYYYIKSIEIDKTLFLSYFNLGNLYINKSRLEDENNSDKMLEVGENYIKKALNLKSCYHEAYTRISYIKIRHQDYKAALDAAIQAVKCNPKSSSARLTLYEAQILSGLGDARKTLDEAFVLDPHDPYIKDKIHLMGKVPQLL